MCRRDSDNPLADLAQEKMKEINEAYDAITKSRSGGGSSGGGYQSYTSSNRGGGYGSSEFSQIRALINAGNLGMAEQVLNASPSRNAEWNFLMGSLYYRRAVSYTHLDVYKRQD